eukprot:GHVS01002884.1.p1 GENE.GHVS01002884.1~~GHVS01002884.1.p1  ORF type:complete len:270 (+),score=27.66 GHVS01002884.1:116-925(+)
MMLLSGFCQMCFLCPFAVMLLLPLMNVVVCLQYELENTTVVFKEKVQRPSVDLFVDEALHDPALTVDEMKSNPIRFKLRGKRRNHDVAKIEEDAKLRKEFMTCSNVSFFIGESEVGMFWFNPTDDKIAYLKITETLLAYGRKYAAARRAISALLNVTMDAGFSLKWDSMKEHLVALVLAAETRARKAKYVLEFLCVDCEAAYEESQSMLWGHHKTMSIMKRMEENLKKAELKLLAAADAVYIVVVATPIIWIYNTFCLAFLKFSYDNGS